MALDTRFDQIRLLEALLFASSEPMKLDELQRHFPGDADLPGLLSELRTSYENRGVNLVQIGDKWAFRTSPDMAPLMRVEHSNTKKLTRAAIETLAIIAYHQPVTRAEIEEIRGVALSKGTLDALLEIGWVRPKGRRRTPGRPVTWATSESFLDHFGLENLDHLPGLDELKASGLLDKRPAIAALGARGDLLSAVEEGIDLDLSEAEEEPLSSNFGEHLVQEEQDNSEEEGDDQSSLPV